MRRTGTTRRGALTATGALALGAALTGCGDGDEAGTRRDPAGADARTTSRRTQKALRAAAARASTVLLARYERTASAHPVTAAGLAPLRAAVREHAAALGAPAKGPAPTPRSASPLPPAASPAPAAEAATALKELAAEERRLADERARALLDAEPELARLLASVAAAGAAHAYLLTELAKETSS
ncbi:hypothetical protein [Streptomyces sp. B1I3]|uniref:hypothetical protein n=1 Tax=Streptomyces sp. B1I3 TaxID=3042264 RepID=UPI00278A271B|nr:hypothetical protein [Streptomyces sp. B1I3]MDQ0793656.1 hypothetical protein [Streptomyces sp. B1I3]